MHNGSQSLMIHGSRAMPPPAPTGEHAADMLRQFQHVMQCFLHTQEVVMHDLTMAFLGAQNRRLARGRPCARARCRTGRRAEGRCTSTTNTRRSR